MNETGTENTKSNSPSVSDDGQLALPILDSARCIVANDTGMMWIGIPLSKFKIYEAFALLDTMKWNAVKWYKSVEDKPKLYTPLMETVSKLLKH